MTKFAIIGSHSSGKSTLSYQLGVHFKRQGKNVDIIQERIRFSPFPFNYNMSVNTALWCFHAQIARELESGAKGFDTVICDRTPLDTFIYAEYFKLEDQYLAECKFHAISWLATYQTVFLINADVPPRADGIRDIKEGFRNGVNDLFQSNVNLICKYMQLNVVKLNSSYIFDKQFNIETLI